MTPDKGPIAAGIARNRGFGILDAMVLIAALGFGLALARGPYLGMNHDVAMKYGYRDYRAWGYAIYYGSLVFPFVTPLTFAIPILALRRSRKPRRRAFLRPGLGGCVAASAGLVLRGLEDLPNYVTGIGWHIMPWIGTGEKVGCFVIGLWVTLAVAGRWKIRAGWLERVGFLLALLWVIGTLGYVSYELRVYGAPPLPHSPVSW